MISVWQVASAIPPGVLEVALFNHFNGKNAERAHSRMGNKVKRIDGGPNEKTMS